MIRQLAWLTGWIAVGMAVPAHAAPTFLIESIARVSDGTRQTGSLSLLFDNDSSTPLNVIGYQARVLFGDSVGVTILGAGGMVDNYLLTPRSAGPVARFDANNRQVDFGDFLISGSVVIQPNSVVGLGTLDFAIEPDAIEDFLIEFDSSTSASFLVLENNSIISPDFVNGRISAQAVPEPSTVLTGAFVAFAFISRQRRKRKAVETTA